MKDYIALTKPRVTWLILATTGIGYYFGARFGWSGWTLFHTILGTCLIASGTAALNQWYEREADAKMKRTRMRPLPAGRISPRGAFIFAVALSVMGFAELAIGANLLTGLLGLFTLLTYLFVYTPMKQRSPHSTTIGAIPGAMPPLIGFAGAAGTLTTEAWILGLILFLWQFPHFYAIAWMYREDYERAGIRMLSVVEPDGESTARRIVWCSAALIPISLLPKFWSMAGNIYVVGAILAGLMFVYYATRIVADHSRVRARAVLLASVVYLPILYGLLVFDHTGL
jgi:protoheme IX farnesyltransferase